jgi:hypothetical protein
MQFVRTSGNGGREEDINTIEDARQRVQMSERRNNNYQQIRPMPSRPSTGAYKIP